MSTAGDSGDPTSATNNFKTAAFSNVLKSAQAVLSMEVKMRAIIAFCSVFLSVLVVGATVKAVGAQPDNVSPVFGVALPEGYRDWKLITVAHEAGKNNDIRGVLGNDIAVKAFREGIRPFPDGAIIARLAYVFKSSPENDAVFPAPQSFVAGDPTNVQISVKDSKKYAATGGWGYGQFENGVANKSEAVVNACYACHLKLDSSKDFVFSHYSP